MATILNLLECSDRVTARHAKGRFAVANIDTVDVLHILLHILRQFDCIATIWECSRGNQVSATVENRSLPRMHYFIVSFSARTSLSVLS